MFDKPFVGDAPKGVDPGPDPDPDPDPDPSAVTYSAIAGDGSTWTKGSTATLAFRFKRSADDDQTFTHFTGIAIDGKAVDSAGYTARAGSVIVDVKPSVLEQLSKGSHEITARFDDGSATAAFTVKEASSSGSGTSAKSATSAKGSASPKTGDSLVGVGVVVLVAALAAVAAIVAFTRLRRKKE